MITQVTVMMKISVLMFFISTVAAEINTENTNLVEPIKCFQCNSGKDPDCASLTVADTNSTYYQVCKEEKRSLGKKPFCRKTIYTILNNNKLVRISRECGWETYKTNNTRCYDVDTDFKYEVSCQCFSDGCNSAPQIMSSRSFILIFLALGLITKLVN